MRQAAEERILRANVQEAPRRAWPVIQPPNAPTRNSLQLRGNYAGAAADYSVEQAWENYSAEEHDIWRTLFTRQMTQIRTCAAPEVLAGLALLGAKPETIPRFSEVNQLLAGATGWRIVGVPGLIPEEQFFAHLAARVFPVSVWIRERRELDYLSEPDLFHDFFGHVALLTNPVFARFMQAYGEAGPKAKAHGAVPLLARLYWYSVEFGLLRTSDGLKVYGAGILSSNGETAYSTESAVPHRVGFDLERIMRTDYRIDDFQRLYFVIDSFEQLFHSGYDTDFAPLYEKLRDLPAIAPEQLLATDEVITRGTVKAPT
jgi:phenylalanine-4-hydroxylase